MRDVLKTYNSYQIAGHVYSYIEMIIIVYIVFTVLFTIFATYADVAQKMEDVILALLDKWNKSKTR